MKVQVLPGVLKISDPKVAIVKYIAYIVLVDEGAPLVTLKQNKMDKTELINKLLWLGFTSAEEGREKRKEAVSKAHNLLDEYLEEFLKNHKFNTTKNGI